MQPNKKQFQNCSFSHAQMYCFLFPDVLLESLPSKYDDCQRYTARALALLPNPRERFKKSC